MAAEPDWRRYERQIDAGLRAQVADDATVEFNQRVRGRFSGVDRQLDVVVTGRFADLDITSRAAVDCKLFSRKVDVQDVEQFAGLLDDINFAHGIMVTTKGFTPAAVARAANVRGLDLQVIPFDELALWRIRNPTYAYTSGANYATLTWREAGEIISQALPKEKVNDIMRQLDRRNSD